MKDAETKKESGYYIRLALKAVRRENRMLDRMIKKQIPAIRRIIETSQNSEERETARRYLNLAKEVA